MTILAHTNLSADAQTILKYLIATKTEMPERHKKMIRVSCHLGEGERAEKAFKELTTAKLLNDCGESVVELSAAGRDMAITLQKDEQAPRNVTHMNTTIHQQDGKVTVVPNQDIYATPLSHTDLLKPNLTGIAPAMPMRRRPAKTEEAEIERTMDRVKHNLPALATHPLRNGMPETPAPRGEAKGVRPAARPKAVAARFMLAFDNQKDALPVPVVSGDVLGRGKTCTIIMRHDEFLSSRHCRFEIMRDKATNRPALYVEDLGSRNGTLVDEYDISGGKAQLYHGSRLQIGETVLVVVEIPY